MATGDLSNAATAANLNDFLNPIDRDALRDQVRRSKPVPNFLIDNFLRPEFAARVVDAYPALRRGGRDGPFVQSGQ